MLSQDFHAGDQELLMAADGELSARRATRVRAHLAACWDCRARMAEIEGTSADFARIHRQISAPKVPPISAARAQLRAQLAELAAKPNAGSWWQFFRSTPATHAAAYICVILLLTAVIGRFSIQHSMLRGVNSAAVSLEREAVPNPSLTPGATRQAAVSDVCLLAHEEVVKAVSGSLRQEVFQEYGIVNPHADDYEIDYLIAPGLGGAEDIRNLWPELYTSPTWNARVKDALEERLHQLVCSGQLDLSTAQRDIARDSIAAYKKYFRTDKPLSLSSDLILFSEE
jgi:anti-sigma factor RsiW